MLVRLEILYVLALPCTFSYHVRFRWVINRLKFSKLIPFQLHTKATDFLKRSLNSSPRR